MGVDKSYKDLVQKIIEKGYIYEDSNREGIYRKEISDYTFKHDFKDGFPALTLKKLAWKSVVTELLWFLKGDTNIKYLLDNGCNIWNKDAYNFYCKNRINKKVKFLPYDKWFDYVKTQPHAMEYGNLGKVYGHYWRNFDGVDQISELIKNMIETPMSSELIVSARNPAHKNQQALPCCHYGFQIVMRPLNQDEQEEYSGLNEARLNGLYDSSKNDEDYLNKLSHFTPKYGFELHWKQRSVDTFLGLPFNIASYALLALILERITGHKALGIQGDLKKVHLYNNSWKGAEELIKRESSEVKVKVLLDKVFDIDVKKYSKNLNMLFMRMSPKDFSLKDYFAQESIKVEMLERTKK